MHHKYLTRSPLFLGPLMNLNHLPWNILYPIRQNLLTAGHSYLIRVVDSELCYLTTSRNNKKKLYCPSEMRQEPTFCEIVSIYIYFSMIVHCF